MRVLLGSRMVQMIHAVETRGRPRPATLPGGSRLFFLEGILIIL